MKMVDVDISKLPFPEAYKFIIGSIVPRPIAWVSTVNAEGRSNLAPFSFFTGVCSNPPTLLFCPVNHPDGREKDTLKNVRDTKQFVVNIASESLVEKMNQTSANYASDVSEFKAVGLTEVKSTVVKPPRVGESPLQLECELLNMVPVGPGGPGSGHVVIGKILYVHVLEAAYSNGRIDVEKIQPVARLGGPNYCPVREVFELERPKV